MPPPAESLRSNLLEILKNERGEIKDAAYNALLAIGESYPRNDRDIFTLEPLSAVKNPLFISTGWWYDLDVLLEYHRKRPTLNTAQYPDEGSQSKKIQDPPCASDSETKTC